MQPNLFLAYPLSPELQEALDHANPTLVALFTQGRPDYLEFIEHNGGRYLGKWIGESSDLSSVEQLKLNVQSLLLRLAPNYPYSATEYVLLAQ